MASPLPSTPDRFPSGGAFDSIVRIEVGTDIPQTFEIHKGVLRFYSRYFQVAITNIEEGRFIESTTNKITLPDEDIAVFKAFFEWLYTRHLPVARETHVTFSHYHMLCKLWSFGDRREIPLLQNECINDLVTTMQSRNEVATCVLPITYADTPANSPLRRFLIDLVTYRMAGHEIFNGTSATYWQEESLLDVAKALVLRPKIQTWPEFQARICEWHVHKVGVQCKK